MKTFLFSKVSDKNGNHDMPFTIVIFCSHVDVLFELCYFTYKKIHVAICPTRGSCAHLCSQSLQVNEKIHIGMCGKSYALSCCCIGSPSTNVGLNANIRNIRKHNGSFFIHFNIAQVSALQYFKGIHINLNLKVGQMQQFQVGCNL